MKASLTPQKKVKEFEHNSHKYWITVEPAINSETHIMDCFLSYVSDTKPTELLSGSLIKDENGNVIRCADELTAFTQANAIKQSEIDSKN